MAVNLSLEDKRFRIAELEGRISQAGPEIPHTLVPHVVTWMLELATFRSILGELEVSTEKVARQLSCWTEPPPTARWRMIPVLLACYGDEHEGRHPSGPWGVG